MASSAGMSGSSLVRQPKDAARWRPSGRVSWRYALRTDIVSGRDTEDLVAARLLASHRRLPLTSLRSRHSASGSDPRLRKAREDLTKVPLRIAGPRQLSSLSVEPFDDVMPEALVVDDADLAAGAEPHRIADIAAKGVLVILTLPRQLVIRAEGIDPTWSRLADVILDIDRPDLRIKHSARPGEADIDVVRNRWGPQRIVPVLFEGHYARFVEMAP